MTRQIIKILGVSVDNLCFEDALTRVENLIDGGGVHYIVTLNPEIVLRAHRDSQFHAVLNGAALSLCDGTGIFLAGMASGKKFLQRITGVDFMDSLCKRAAEKQWKVAFVGASQGARETLLARYGQTHPTALFQSIADEDGREAVDADIIFVALGAPKQEEWMVSYRRLPGARGVMVGVGGAFDMMAGVLPRAPYFLRSLGLEWAWRFMLQPRRFRRIVNAVIVFPIVCGSGMLRNLWYTEKVF